MAKRTVSRKSTRSAKSKRGEVVIETTRVEREPVHTVVRTPATLAEAVGDPVAIVPEAEEETKVVRTRTVRRKKAS